ncbi:MAG: aspartate-semialdehyde dehydrogenase [Gemmatimonadota bacterium]
MTERIGRERIPVGILGATGAVGQRLVERLDGHAWFEVREVGASRQSAGRPYGEAVTWRLPGDVPAAVAGLRVKDVTEPWESVLLFSALDAAVAGGVEAQLAARGHAVMSNARSHRLDPDVPLLIPEVNPDHLGLLALQRERGPGILVTNPNCSAIGLCLALAPLHRAFGVEAVEVVTLQSLSGAGYPGVAALDAADNVIPFIEGEEPKLVEEPRKVLGRWTGAAVEPAQMTVSAQVHRVPVSEGHQLALSVKLRQAASPEEVSATLARLRGRPQELALPSAPRFPIHVLSEPDRPQPRLDRDRERGMAITVGRVRRCPVLDVRLSVLVHNTIRGAAGAAILNAELCVAERHIPIESRP